MAAILGTRPDPGTRKRHLAAVGPKANAGQSAAQSLVRVVRVENADPKAADRLAGKLPLGSPPGAAAGRIALPQSPAAKAAACSVKRRRS